MSACMSPSPLLGIILTSLRLKDLCFSQTQHPLHINYLSTSSPHLRRWQSSQSAKIKMKFMESINEKVEGSFIGKYFQLKERGSSFSTELAGASATFLTMAYILAVNPRILADSGGPCVPSDDGGECISFFVLNISLLVRHCFCAHISIHIICFQVFLDKITRNVSSRSNSSMWLPRLLVAWLVSATWIWNVMTLHVHFNCYIFHFESTSTHFVSTWIIYV